MLYWCPERVRGKKSCKQAQKLEEKVEAEGRSSSGFSVPGMSMMGPASLGIAPGNVNIEEKKPQAGLDLGMRGPGLLVDFF